jgi:hypothetical protein
MGKRNQQRILDHLCDIRPQGATAPEIRKALGGFWLYLTIYADLGALVDAGLVREEWTLAMDSVLRPVCRHYVTDETPCPQAA